MSHHVGKDAYKSLYRVAQGEYDPRISWTTAREFTLNPLLVADIKSYIPAEVVAKKKSEFVPDPQFPQYKLGGNG